jgi:thioredoxin-related protein
MRFYLIGLFLLVGCLAANSQPASAENILTSATKKAASANKNVLVIFSASWCGWCRRMEASLADAEVAPLINKYYEIAHLTVYESGNKKVLENPGALAWLTENGGADEGLPYWFVIDKNKKVLANAERKPGENTGCPASEEEVAYFISVLKKTSALTAKELEAIKKRFRQNEQ